MSESKFATVAWTATDLQTLFSIDKESAEEWLQLNERYIQDELVMLGWDVLESLGASDGLVITDE